MSHKIRKSKGKQINPTFFVFCEGKTEEQYIEYLRSKFKEYNSAQFESLF